MAQYKITKVMKYTETVIVEADDVPSAIDKCYTIDGEDNNDDYLYDVQVQLILD